jgi:predicted CoA-binding protein
MEITGQNSGQKHVRDEDDIQNSERIRDLNDVVETVDLVELLGISDLCEPDNQSFLYQDSDNSWVDENTGEIPDSKLVASACAAELKNNCLLKVYAHELRPGLQDT